MLGFHTASLFGPTYDRVFDGVVPPRTGAVSVINRVSCMCCEPGGAARLVHLAGASRVADGLDRCPGVPGGSKMTCLYVTPVCTTRVDVRARIWRFLRRLSWRGSMHGQGCQGTSAETDNCTNGRPCIWVHELIRGCHAM